MTGRPPDIEKLKRIARETYDDWSKSQPDPGAAADGVNPPAPNPDGPS
jgi:hypothetical protein